MGIEMPEDLKYEYELSQKYAAQELPGWSASDRICKLIERIANLEQALTVVKDACDRDWKDETPQQIAAIASSAMFWRNDEIRRLRDELSRLRSQVEAYETKATLWHFIYKVASIADVPKNRKWFRDLGKEARELLTSRQQAATEKG